MSVAKINQNHKTNWHKNKFHLRPIYFLWGFLWIIIFFIFTFQFAYANNISNTNNTDNISNDLGSFEKINLYQEQPSFSDPLEPINRPIFKINQWLDSHILLPVSKGYQTITPEVIDDSISNFFNNLGNITSSFNFLLQGEFQKSEQTLVRFLSNTTFGVLGFYDIATNQGIEQYKTDFNDTLKKWKLASGSYIVLPIFGPNTPRTIAGGFVDSYTDPTSYLNPSEDQTFLRVLGFVDFRADNQNLFELAQRVGFDAYDSTRLFFLNQENKPSKSIDLDDYDDFEPLE